MCSPDDVSGLHSFRAVPFFLPVMAIPPVPLQDAVVLGANAFLGELHMPLSLPTFLLIAAVIEALFGVGFLLLPEAVLAPLGVKLNAAGIMMTRIFGAALIAFALVFWWLRELPSSQASTAVFRAASIYFVVSAVPLLLGITGGLANAMGWGTFVIHVLLAAGFWHFGFRK